MRRIAALLFVLVSCTPPALAQSSGAVHVGVLDIQRVLRESEAVANLSQTVEAMRAKELAAMREKEEAFRRLDLELANQRDSMETDVYTKERQKLQSQVTAEQRDFQQKKKELDQVFRQGMAQIQGVLVQAAQEIAEEQELDLILDKATVVLVRQEYEITVDVIALLNERLPEVELLALQGE